ncbi:hypothetical protein ACFC1T_09455 [Kitasatospora sp. NPDC056076]|uniref:hypothetical protein n=1 Tax=Kitasatospora sp. NPDC056076 TaxID=3345703 RepID=UPI0035DEAB46
MSDDVRDPWPLWWLSFYGEKQHLGVAIVPGRSVSSAAALAWEIEVHPGGQVLGVPLPPGSVAPKWQGRLMPYSETEDIPMQRVERQHWYGALAQLQEPDVDGRVLDDWVLDAVYFPLPLWRLDGDERVKVGEVLDAEWDGTRLQATGVLGDDAAATLAVAAHNGELRYARAELGPGPAEVKSLVLCGVTLTNAAQFPGDPYCRWGVL